MHCVEKKNVQRDIFSFLICVWPLVFTRSPQRPVTWLLVMKLCSIRNHIVITLRGRHNGCDDISNLQPRDCLLSRLIRRRSKKTSKLRVSGLCAGNSQVTGEFPAQISSYAENVSIWWLSEHYLKLFNALSDIMLCFVNTCVACLRTLQLLIYVIICVVVLPRGQEW